MYQFARHGIPDIVVSDNGPQYSSHEFRKFAQTWQFNHVTSSPTYPQSNGMAERTIQTVKQILKKAIKNGDDPYLSLLEFRNTPIDDNLGSPCQLLMNRRTKSLLPTSSALLEPEVQGNVQKKLEDKKNVQKKYYDRNTVQLPEIKEGDTVRVQKSDKTWELAKVVRKTEKPRSFIVKTKTGEIRRNRKHLIKTNENPPEHEASDMMNWKDANPDNNQVEPEPEPPNVHVEQRVVTRSGRQINPPRRYIED